MDYQEYKRKKLSRRDISSRKYRSYMIDGINYGNFENLDQIGEGGRFRAIKTFCNKKKYIFKPFLVGKTVIQKDAGAVSNKMEINFLESCLCGRQSPRRYPFYHFL